MSECKAMDQRKRAVPSKRCEARARKGTLCAHPAGYRTDHLGAGRCACHGGSTPSQRKHVTQERALDFARDALCAEIEADLLAAMMRAARLACGVTAYQRQRIATMQRLTRADEEALERAVLMQSRVAKAALDAGIEGTERELAA